MKTSCFCFTLRCLLMLVFVIAGTNSHAQCSNWSTSVQVTTASTCASNGTFTAALTGPDVANLSNIQYGIPISASGFSVPLNTSPNVAPAVFNISTRASLSCAATGKLIMNVNNGVLPITYNITTHPSRHSGPPSQTLNSRTCTFANLPPGSYTVRAIDACFTSTPSTTTTVASLNPTSAQYNPLALQAQSCDTLIVAAPAINENLGGWAGYGFDTSFKYSVQVSGGISAATPFVRMPDSSTAIKMPASQSLKNCYGKTITYTVKPPYGSNNRCSAIAILLI